MRGKDSSSYLIRLFIISSFIWNPPRRLPPENIIYVEFENFNELLVIQNPRIRWN